MMERGRKKAKNFYLFGESFFTACKHRNSNKHEIFAIDALKEINYSANRRKKRKTRAVRLCLKSLVQISAFSSEEDEEMLF